MDTTIEWSDINSDNIKNEFDNTTLVSTNPKVDNVGDFFLTAEQERKLLVHGYVVVNNNQKITDEQKRQINLSK